VVVVVVVGVVVVVVVDVVVVRCSLASFLHIFVAIAGAFIVI
jgi:hypothetical protein